ncbi:MAG: DNA polymerase III subunit delta [Ectothiorhodospiraceae bacterium]|nr:DNA polymerase III subunit delta [Ectothiorhodospiraceae bacterium]
MKLFPDKLEANLKKALLPVYFFSGDEPLQLGESADAVRRHARKQGYTEREVMHAEKGFDWNELLSASNAMSLFAEKRVIDLRLPSGKPGKDGGAVLAEYVERPPEDTILLISSGKVDKRSQSAKWYKALDTVGVTMQVWPVETAEMPRWLDQRLRSRGLQPDRESVRIIAERVEGNLLAAAQEVDKLLLLNGPGPLSAEQVEAAVADSARFDVFGLVDTALAGDAARLTRMLDGLRAEGVEPILVLWALTRELRSLADMAAQIESGKGLDGVLARVWGKRKGPVKMGLQRHNRARWQQMLRRAARLDRVIKGAATGNAWDELLQLTLLMAGVQLFRAAG